MILQMTLLLFMAAAAVKDYRSYWVPNELILAGALNGYILRFWADGSGGVIDGAAGMVLIFILCAGFFVLSMFGAGDLKLMMAMAVYMGPPTATWPSGPRHSPRRRDRLRHGTRS